MNEKTKTRNDLIRISVLEEEIAVLRSRLQPHDTGHISTAISVLEDRVRDLKGIKKEYPTGEATWGQGFC